MKTSAPTRVLSLFLLAAFVLAGAAPAEAQLFDRIKKRVQREAEQRIEDRAAQAARSAMDLTEDAVVCVVTDRECVEDARQRGEDPILVDEDGEPVNDAERQQAEAQRRGASQEAPAAGISGADANFDFEPGQRVLFADDFARDNVGDFPRRLTFREGSMEVVQHEGGRALRAKTTGAFDVVLPEAAPETFTVEFDYFGGEDFNDFQLLFVDAEGNPAGTNTILVDNYGGVGVERERAVYYDDNVVRSLQVDERLRQQTLPVRVMADGQYVKVFVGQERVANVPNADLGRSDRLRFLLTDVRGEPIYFANFRIAAGGRDLYSTLEAEGRAVTEGVLFDTGSATLRPESFAVVQEIAAMLKAHPDLRVGIEGHTDNEGTAESNLTLSQERAEAVQAMLIGLGVGADRLEAAGLGDTQPVADNATPEGRQTNRRVELVVLQ